MIRVGRCEVASVVNGWIRLDGGAMFGVVPRVLWAPTQDVDDRNRMLMAMRTLVVADREAGRVMLVDSGAGSKWSKKEAARYAIEDRPEALVEGLERMGLGVDDVTDVVITHAHFDHAGGVLVHDGDGRPRPRFARATHWVHERHLRHALGPHAKDRASFMDRDFQELERTATVHLVQGDDPDGPMDGVRWLISHGHTPYQLLVLIADDEAPLLFTGDMIPTSTHLPAPWVMAYDMQPTVTIEEKTRVLHRCATEGWRLAFPHDRRMGGAVVDTRGKRPRVATPLDLDP